MNYLGHILLSGNNEKLLIGNFIGDYVKGKQYLNYPLEIQKGILFHRIIDEYTDSNVHWLTVRELLKPVYKRYSGVVADIIVDHYLAKNWEQFHKTNLEWHSKWTYAEFLKHYDVLPKRVQGFLPYLIQHRRLQSYKALDGIYESLQIMSLRTSLPDKLAETKMLLDSSYIEIEKHSLKFLYDILESKNDLLSKIH